MSSSVRATVRAVTRSKLVSQRAALVLTDSAVARIKELMKNKPEMVGVRIGVSQKGCSGLSYTLQYATEKKKFDEEVNQNGACVLIDAKAQLTLLGTEMDFVEGKMSSEFVFNNPNVTGTCGCGESFTV